MKCEFLLWYKTFKCILFIYYLQMTEMHAELVEFNEILQKKLANREAQILSMTNQIAALNGRVNTH